MPEFETKIHDSEDDEKDCAQILVDGKLVAEAQIDPDYHGETVVDAVLFDPERDDVVQHHVQNPIDGD